MARIRVMVVDDHEVVRDGLKTILSLEGDLEVVGEAGTAEEAVQKAPRLTPDVVLMDVRLGAGSGIDACRAIKSVLPAVRVLMFSSFGEEDAVMAAVMSGASGYLLKNAGRAELLKAIRAVAAGHNLLDPAVTKQMVDKLVRLAAKESERALEGVSEREREVLTLVAQGHTNKEIAERLIISENTARNHVSRILEKLGLSRRSEAAVFAAQHGLIKDDKARDDETGRSR